MTNALKNINVQITNMMKHVTISQNTVKLYQLPESTITFRENLNCKSLMIILRVYQNITGKIYFNNKG